MSKSKYKTQLLGASCFICSTSCDYVPWYLHVLCIYCLRDICRRSLPYYSGGHRKDCFSMEYSQHDQSHTWIHKNTRKYTLQEVADNIKQLKLRHENVHWKRRTCTRPPTLASLACRLAFVTTKAGQKWKRDDSLIESKSSKLKGATGEHRSIKCRVPGSSHDV